MVCLILVKKKKSRASEGQRCSVACIHNQEPHIQVFGACLNESYLCNYSAPAYLWLYWRMAAQNIDETQWHLAILVLSFSNGKEKKNVKSVYSLSSEFPPPPTHPAKKQKLLTQQYRIIEMYQRGQQDIFDYLTVNGKNRARRAKTKSTEIINVFTLSPFYIAPHSRTHFFFPPYGLYSTSEVYFKPHCNAQRQQSKSGRK